MQRSGFPLRLSKVVPLTGEVNGFIFDKRFFNAGFRTMADKEYVREISGCVLIY